MAKNDAMEKGDLVNTSILSRISPFKHSSSLSLVEYLRCVKRNGWHLMQTIFLKNNVETLCVCVRGVSIWFRTNYVHSAILVASTIAMDLKSMRTMIYACLWICLLVFCGRWAVMGNLLLCTALFRPATRFVQCAFTTNPNKKNKQTENRTRVTRCWYDYDSPVSTGIVCRRLRTAKSFKS